MFVYILEVLGQKSRNVGSFHKSLTFKGEGGGNFVFLYDNQATGGTRTKSTKK